MLAAPGIGRAVLKKPRAPLWTMTLESAPVMSLLGKDSEPRTEVRGRGERRRKRGRWGERDREREQESGEGRERERETEIEGGREEEKE